MYRSEVISRIAAYVKQHGVLQAVQDMALRSVNRLMLLKILHCMKLDGVNPEFLTAPQDYRGMFLKYEQVRDFAESPECELPQSFVDDAFAKGDQCYGFIHKDTLAAYQWYATTPTETSWNGLVVRCNDQYVYMYKGFTHPNHRGKRLYPVGVVTALRNYLSHGYKGILSFVESNNYASLKACYRMGYRDFGKIYVLSLFHRCLLYSEPGCEAYGFRMTRKDGMGVSGRG